MLRVLGAVILYNPDAGILDHVRTYIHEVDHLLVIDNSEPASVVGDMLRQSFDHVTLIQNQQNLGIAHALNQAAQYGVGKSFEWLLTMDQDSSFHEGSVRKMKDYLQKDGELPAILAPFHQTPEGRGPTGESTKEVRMTMTSGNLLNLKAYSACGLFEEKLFIDSVDHEYCLRLRKAGYKIVRLNDAVLYHKLGDIKYHRILGMKFKTTNHSALRKYYITRNRLYVMRKYLSFDRKFVMREFRELIKSFWTVLLFETDKAGKTGAMIRGMWHFATGRYGKI